MSRSKAQRFLAVLGRILLGILRLALALAFLGAVVLRLAVRDSFDYPWSTLYYLSPLPLLALLALPECALQIGRRRWWPAALVALCVLLPLGCWLAQSLRLRCDPQAPREEDTIRIVFWNADNFERLRIPEAALQLASLEADLILLNEGVIDYGTQKRVFPTAFPDHEMNFLPGGRLVLLRKGARIRQRHFSIVGRADASLNQLVFEFGEKSFLLLSFDHRSDPEVSRRFALHKLAAAIEHLGGIPLVLLGDFNTPVDSVHLSPIAERLTNAFSAAGHGLAETWPMPLPLLTLDQAWTGGGVEPVRCFHVRMEGARHQAVVLEIKAETTIDPSDKAFPAHFRSPYPGRPRIQTERQRWWQKRWQQ